MVNSIIYHRRKSHQSSDKEDLLKHVKLVFYSTLDYAQFFPGNGILLSLGEIYYIREH